MKIREEWQETWISVIATKPYSEACLSMLTLSAVIVSESRSKFFKSENVNLILALLLKFSVTLCKIT